MATYDEFMPEIKLHCYAAPDPTIEMMLRLTAIDFCKRTLVWQQTTQDFAFAGEGRVDFAALDDTDQRFERVMKAWYRTTPLDVVAPEHLDSALVRFSSFTLAGATMGAPRECFELPGERTTIGVWPIPVEQEQDAFTFKVALVPADTATQLPDILRRDHNEAIIDGALSRLMGIRGQPFTDIAEADRRKLSYKRAVLDARIAATLGVSVAGDVSVQMNPFIRGHN
jgi:hypothetical protein